MESFLDLPSAPAPSRCPFCSLSSQDPQGTSGNRSSWDSFTSLLLPGPPISLCLSSLNFLIWLHRVLVEAQGIFSCGMMGSNSLTRDWTRALLHWELRVLTAGLPGKSRLFLDLLLHFAGDYRLVASWERVSSEQVPQELAELKCRFSDFLLTAHPSGSRVSVGHHFPEISGRRSFTAPATW